MREYKPYNIDQLFLLPPSMRDWLSESQQDDSIELHPA